MILFLSLRLLSSEESLVCSCELIHLDVAVGPASGLVGLLPLIVEGHCGVTEDEIVLLKDSLHQFNTLTIISTVGEVASHLLGLGRALYCPTVPADSTLKVG